MLRAPNARSGDGNPLGMVVCFLLEHRQVLSLCKLLAGKIAERIGSEASRTGSPHFLALITAVVIPVGKRLGFLSDEQDQPTSDFWLNPP